MLNAQRIAAILTERFGVPLIGEATDEPDGQRARFRPRDLAHTQGFSVGILIGWRTVEAEFTPGTYAAQLLALMARSDAAQRTAFRTFVQASLADGGKVTFHINGVPAAPLQPDQWPQQWNSLSFGMSKGPMVIDGRNPDALEALALAWSGRILGSALCLIPLEPVQQKPVGEAEGGAYMALVTKYERSPINRAACIELQGTRCKVCGFDFEKVYGPIGSGYIEVHHVESIASLAPGTVLDPAKDLVPLCSNCHSMAHKRRPLPYTVDELKVIIREAEVRRSSTT